MRARSSVALPKAPQLMFAAICSAADAIAGLFHANAALTVFPDHAALGKL
jgi:hypothetical protein